MAIPYLLHTTPRQRHSTNKQRFSLSFKMKLAILIAKGQACTTVIRMQCLITRQGEKMSWFDLRVLCLRA